MLCDLCRDEVAYETQYESSPFKEPRVLMVDALGKRYVCYACVKKVVGAFFDKLFDKTFKR